VYARLSQAGSGRGAALMAHDRRHATFTVLGSGSATVDRGESPLPIRYAVTARRAFRGSSDQIACVREFVRLALGPVPVLDEAVLLASELSTNAVVHTASGDRGTFDVAVCRYASSVRVEVRDAGSRRVPVTDPHNDLAEEGCGLGLVDLVADRWGHSGDCEGRSVYFELCW
jgi:anti-sigma regulatory factor (Ser/Thr protein kinase)